MTTPRRIDPDVRRMRELFWQKMRGEITLDQMQQELEAIKQSWQQPSLYDEKEELAHGSHR